MLTGTIKQLVHLSEQSHVENAQLVPSHNGTGYGRLQGLGDAEVYFRFDIVEDCKFDELWEGQEVGYELEKGTQDRAALVKPVHGDAQPHRSGVKNPEPPPEEDL